VEFEQLKVRSAIEGDSPELPISTGIHNDKFWLEAEHGNEADAKFSNFCEVVLFVRGKQASQFPVDDISVHSFAEISNLKAYSAWAGQVLSLDFNLLCAGVHGVLNEFAQAGERVTELVYQVFEDFIYHLKA